MGTFGPGYSLAAINMLNTPTIANEFARLQTGGKDVCPSFAIKTAMRDLFVDSKSLIICSTARSAIKLEQKTGLTIIHQNRLESMHSYPLGPTRIYTTTKALYLLAAHRYINLLVILLCIDNEGKPYFRTRTRTPIIPSNNSDSESGLSWASNFGSGRRESALQMVNLEICLVPHKEGDDEQLQLAVDVRDALDKFHKAAQKANGTDEHSGVLRIFVGDDIPPCPCCGRRR